MNTKTDLKIGIIGCDTSHVPAFTKLLNDENQEFHVAGGRVAAAFPGGSPDFALSRDRVEGFSQELRDTYGVQIVDAPEIVAEQCDAILLTSVDGRAHLELFRAIAPSGKPVFIDKPFAVSTTDAAAIVELAREHHVSLMSSSGLRYAQPFVELLEAAGKESVTGADFYGPMAIEATQPGLFWYGIHTVEMLYAAFGRGCERVVAVSNETHDVVTGVWKDGRLGTIRGNRAGNSNFGALLHTASGSHWAECYKHPKPGYAGLLEHMMPMFQGEAPPIDIEDTLEIVRFIEAANESRGSGQSVML